MGLPRSTRVMGVDYPSGYPPRRFFFFFFYTISKLPVRPIELDEWEKNMWKHEQNPDSLLHLKKRANVQRIFWIFNIICTFPNQQTRIMATARRCGQIRKGKCECRV